MSDYRALYRKWRPTDFDDVVGQDAITDILKYEVAGNKTSHAYLFCGSRGTGKTSCAKILAKAVNCERPINGNPCNECEACRSINAGIATDVIEMDAASNTGVDDVRDMKDEIAFTPALLKYRVYIIDEVHMMSTSAFNALLKTLEEPPTYVIFILATTEFHKLPTTIVSRCQRFDFKRISSHGIVSRLAKIAESEGIELTEEGAKVIARVARGGMRDAVSLLELCAGARRPITAELVFETVGTGNRDGAYTLIRAILDRNYSAVYSTVADIVEKSGDISVFWQEVIDSYRDVMVVKNTEEAKSYLDLTDSEYEALSALAKDFTPARLAYHTSILEAALGDMQRAFNSKRSIAEIALTRMCDARTSMTPEALALRVDELERELALMKLGAPVAAPSAEPKPVQKPESKPAAAPKSNTAEPKPAEKPRADTSAPEPVAQRAPFARWRAVVERIGELKRSLGVQFANSEAYTEPDGSYLIFMNDFFAKMLVANEQDLSLIRGVIAAECGADASAVKITVLPKTRSDKGDLGAELIGRIDS